MNINKEIYNSKDIVNKYKQKSYLFKGEKILIENLKNNINNGKMLDIGIGTGRTTKYFSQYFNKYVGIDYAEEMINTAKQTYKNKNIQFFCLDAKNMNIFNDNEFDYILFSFNGIDCVSFDDRLKILTEIKRIAKPRATFVYSTHNIYNIPKLFSFHMPKNPLNIIPEIKRVKKINTINKNPDQLLKSDYVIITDGDIDFSVQYYYGNMNFEFEQLKKIGFTPKHFYSLKNGSKYSNKTKWENITTPWILIETTVNE